MIAESVREDKEKNKEGIYVVVVSKREGEWKGREEGRRKKGRG